ncbi:unnamed protein product [Sphenostylis stenocarpa]|uniref:Uncharacterized protein n=1 Tax=Sphenostylis stenocarpa TaxID=92480 RepID=A0AA86SEB0_9FABA|nr:unnamed protein product [Sphenostylis stenocarpa]
MNHSIQFEFEFRLLVTVEATPSSVRENAREELLRTQCNLSPREGHPGSSPNKTTPLPTPNLPNTPFPKRNPMSLRWGREGLRG